MIEWVFNNKDWLFSGIGVTGLSIGTGWFMRQRKTRGIDICADNRSVAAKTIKNSTISTGDTTGK